MKQKIKLPKAVSFQPKTQLQLMDRKKTWPSRSHPKGPAKTKLYFQRGNTVLEF